MINEILTALAVSVFTGSLAPEERECLALNIYFESRDQSMAGMIGVAQVALNRVNDPRFPDSVCEVVKQGRLSDPPDAPIRIGACQFSWYCDGKSDQPKEEVAWETSRRKAAHAFYLHQLGYDMTEGSTHYHADNVYPDWADTITRVGQIDDHIFYRWE